jgi:hypothetical protein
LNVKATGTYAGISIHLQLHGCHLSDKLSLHIIGIKGIKIVAQTRGTSRIRCLYASYRAAALRR